MRRITIFRILSHTWFVWVALGVVQVPDCASAQAGPVSLARAGTPIDSSAAAPAEQHVSTATDMIWAIKIPMRDGIKLNGTVFKPSGQKDPLPVIFTLTPYIADTYQERASYFAKHGYVFVLVDARGRGSSEGEFDPFAQEPRDGYDIVEFLSRQPWCNGKVTMWGGSYAGYDQWATLKESPPHLATIVPVAAVHPGVDFPFYKHIWATYVMQWLTLTSGRTANENLFGESSFWLEKNREWYLGQRPYTALDQVVGNTVTVFQKWMQHRTDDDYWQAMNPTPEQYSVMEVPILTITGDYDGDQPGALSFYRAHMKFGAPGVTSRHFLIIGPWDHPGTRTPKKDVAGLTFGEASLLDMNDLHRQWYDWTMRDGPKPEFLKKRVAYYVVGAGAENWKYADDLDSIAREHRKLYLSSQGGSANDVFHSGMMCGQPDQSDPDKFTYDPADLRPAELEKEDIPNSLTDQRFALNLFGNGVVYHSEPFTEATEISGDVKLSVWIAMDVPDTDLSATLYEILPNGLSVQLTSDAMRTRYRDSSIQTQFAEAGKVVRYDLNDFTWFSRRISKGSRLRLVLNCINSSFSEKNYNSGGDVENEAAKDARVAHVTVYHDTDHPSALEIPIVN